ncbi:MAG: 50S ribosomal protein L16 [Candidatus Bathyarchaeota archaeon]|nr:50S ribosomal protein L16 [Candidatus Bathyarchaeota archaeon]MCZ2845289.1 50S ribosomal protein L16 [Candidatus Bathyarchaeota archaeon]
MIVLKGKDYRVISGQPYTRKKFIHGEPQSKISKFIMGDSKRKFSYKISMMSLNAVQITHNALEAARIAANKILADVLGDKEYLMHIRVYPHNVLRENKMIATAGADRLQEGMRRSFGKPFGRAARIKENQAIIDVYVNEKQGLKVAKKALETSAKKLPTSCRIVFENLDKRGS